MSTWDGSAEGSREGDGVYERAPDQVSRTVTGEAIIVPMRNHVADLSSLYVLNRTGAWVWENLDGRRSNGALAREMASRFAVDVAEAYADLEELLAELAAEGLVRRLGEERREGGSIP